MFRKPRQFFYFTYIFTKINNLRLNLSVYQICRSILPREKGEDIYQIC